MLPTKNDNKLLTKRVQASGRSTVILSYTTSDAQALRNMAKEIILKSGKKASLSLLSRRSLQIYALILANPSHLVNELQVLNKMVTPLPSPSKASTTQKVPE